MQLRAAFLANPRIVPLQEGAVLPEGAEIDIELGHPATLHLRHLRENSFDVFEFSLAAYFAARDRPAWAHLGWTALPVFLAKAFLPLELLVHRDAGIGSFADLRGKRVGLPDFGMTAGVWLRIMLRRLHGIGVEEVTWFNGRRPHQRQSVVLGETFPPGVAVQEVPEVTALDAMLHRGEVDAAFGDYLVVPITPGPDVAPLLDARAGERVFAEFRQATGATPINHTLVVQQRLLHEHPDLARSLYDAFEAAKQETYGRARWAAGALLLFPTAVFNAQAERFGEDPYPSGLAANRATLELLAEQLLLEGALSRRPDVPSLFAEATE